MNSKLNRRRFFSTSVLASAGAGLALRADEPNAGSGQTTEQGQVAPGSKGTLPTGKIGKLTVSRLLSGGAVFLK